MVGPTRRLSNFSGLGDTSLSTFNSLAMDAGETRRCDLSHISGAVIITYISEINASDGLVLFVGSLSPKTR
jgi:hypothetical protein